MKGFTLLELLVVLTILAVASGGVVLALRGNEEQHIQREAQRLVAMLEAARAESRASGVAIRWQAENSGFAFSSQTETHTWLHPGTRVSAESTTLVLGPEPIIPPQRLTLSLGQHSLHIATDGLSPFAVVWHAAP